jgi:hypothetical protein
MKTIEIVVSPEGKSRVETRGFSGNSCREASRFIECALGNRVSETLTAEFHQTQPTSQEQARERG